VVSYDNAVALAETVGMMPQELFKIACDYIKLKEKDFKIRRVEAEENYLIEMLVSEYKQRLLAKQEKDLPAYSMTEFYNTDYVQNWFKRTGINYDYKRFTKQLNKWIRVFSSVAKKKKN
jgi:hypothetical protein